MPLPFPSSIPSVLTPLGAPFRKWFLLPVIVILLVLLAGALEVRRREAVAELRKLSITVEEVLNQTQATERARDVVERVSRLMKIPSEEATVATIVDVEALREQNAFYNLAENGDFLVITRSRAILYDPEENIILDVVPVQINQAEETGVTEGR